MINIIVAVDQNEGIGKDGKLPWPKIPSDMKRFRDLTKNSVVIMGRKTYDSIGKPLKGRFNIVLTSACTYVKDYEQGTPVLKTNSVELALERAQAECKDIFILGGESVYKEFMPVVDRVMITTIHNKYDCDTRFPFDTMWEHTWHSEEIRYPNRVFHNDPMGTFFEILRKVKR